MVACKITVVKTPFYEDLAERFGGADLGPCPIYKPGKSWLIWHYGRPLDLCEDAWTSIHRFVYAILCQAGSKLGGTWLDDGRFMLASCNDGIRGVVFSLERVDIDEAKNG